jgi:hypothetical protein
MIRGELGGDDTTEGVAADHPRTDLGVVGDHVGGTIRRQEADIVGWFDDKCGVACFGESSHEGGIGAGIDARTRVEDHPNRCRGGRPEGNQIGAHLHDNSVAGAHGTQCRFSGRERPQPEEQSTQGDDEQGGEDAKYQADPALSHPFSPEMVSGPERRGATGAARATRR